VGICGAILMEGVVELDYPDIQARSEASHSTGGKEGLKERVQCLADFAETQDAATLDAAFP